MPTLAYLMSIWTLVIMVAIWFAFLTIPTLGIAALIMVGLGSRAAGLSLAVTALVITVGAIILTLSFAETPSVGLWLLLALPAFAAALWAAAR